MKMKTEVLLAAMTLLGGLCVAVAQPGVRYPYVDTSDAQNGPVIVSRDARGGASASVFHPDWITTPTITIRVRRIPFRPNSRSPMPTWRKKGFSGMKSSVPTAGGRRPRWSSC